MLNNLPASLKVHMYTVVPKLHSKFPYPISAQTSTTSGPKSLKPTPRISKQIPSDPIPPQTSKTFSFSNINTAYPKTSQNAPHLSPESQKLQSATKTAWMRVIVHNYSKMSCTLNVTQQTEQKPQRNEIIVRRKFSSSRSFLIEKLNFNCCIVHDFFFSRMLFFPSDMEIIIGKLLVKHLHTISDENLAFLRKAIEQFRAIKTFKCNSDSAIDSEVSH
jgi:hypothetical protein